MNHSQLRHNQPPHVAKPSMALMLLFALFAFFLILTPILTGLLGKVCHKADAVLRIAMVIQDLLVFILPAIITALLSSRLPAQLLGVDMRPGGMSLCLSLITMIVSMPVMNIIIEWNQNIQLPESFGAFEDAMRQLEANAQAVTDSLMAGASVLSLVVSILIVGVLAGFSEELFFRGALQRILSATRMNMHAVIWTVAFLFSLLHFQFFGFIPRMLLGAYFGYLCWWSKSLWLPICIHVFNNSLVVFTAWHGLNSTGAEFDIDKLGTDLSSTSGVAMVCVSLLLTALTLAATRKACLGRHFGIHHER